MRDKIKIGRIYKLKEVFRYVIPFRVERGVLNSGPEVQIIEIDRPHIGFDGIGKLYMDYTDFIERYELFEGFVE